MRVEVVQEAMITKFISSGLQLADIFTKPLPNIQFHALRTKLGIVYHPKPNLKGDVRQLD